MEDFFDEEEEDWGSPVTHLIAGAVAGTVEHCGMFPVDTIKTHIQAQSSKAKEPFLTVVKGIVAKRGTAGLFSGLSAMISGAAPAHAVYFCTYELFKGYFGGKKGDGEHHPLAYFSAGIIATVFSEATFTPMDSVKQRLQLGVKDYKGVLDCCRQTYRSQGLWKGFYSGYTTTLIMNIPYSGVYFSTYELLKRLMLKNEKEHSNLVNCLAGGGAGVLSAALTNPLDVARTRLQTQLDVSTTRKYHSMHHAIKVLWKEEGMVGFTSGIYPRMIFHSTSAAICWATYEYMKVVLS